MSVKTPVGPPLIPSFAQLAATRAPGDTPGMVTGELLDVLPRTAGRDAEGRLTVGGVALADVAAEFGTPAFVADEQGCAATAREYLEAFASRHAAHRRALRVEGAAVRAADADAGRGGARMRRRVRRRAGDRARRRLRPRRTSSCTATPRATATSATRSRPGSG